MSSFSLSLVMGGESSHTSRIMSTAELASAAQKLSSQVLSTQSVDLSEATQLWTAQQSSASLQLQSMTASKQHVALVLDIEGTTTPLPFVTKVLYPHSESHLAAFLAEQYPQDVDVVWCVAEAAKVDKATATALERGDNEQTRRTFGTHLMELIAANSKAPYLKLIQGRIWRGAYEDGSVKGHLFSDAAVGIRTWSRGPSARTGAVAASAPACPTSVWIYSSGSIAAQKLLFAHSTHGDLTPLLAGYFDPTTVGAKTDVVAYRNIRASIVSHLKGNDDTITSEAVGIVFLTDHLGEVAAARSSGAVNLTEFLSRPLNNEVTDAAIVEALSEPACASASAQRMGDVGSIMSFDQLTSGASGAADDSRMVATSLQRMASDVQCYRSDTAMQQRSFL